MVGFEDLSSDQEEGDVKGSGRSSTAAASPIVTRAHVPAWVNHRLQSGVVIPAHPLALTPEGAFDEIGQRAMTRYYHAAGAGGFAVAVHTTQFEIRDPRYGLFEPVLELAAETVLGLDATTARQSVLIAGVCGSTKQAVKEATVARDLGYHIALLSLSALPEADDDALIAHCRAVADVIPIFGFYLQPAVGGRKLSVDFWRRLGNLPGLVGVKIAPFDRYKTLDVIRGIATSQRHREVVLYTGNDDTIVVDLLTEYQLPVDGETVRLSMVGGLLGHWACWTQKAVELLRTCQQARCENRFSAELLTLSAQVTDCNAALFDAENHFAGCIAGIQYVLFRQGLLSSQRCLNPAELLSPGQQQAIERVRSSYPHLLDDEFVMQHVDQWRR